MLVSMACRQKDGKLEQARAAIEGMATRGDTGLREAFLAACKVHGKVSYAEIAAGKAPEIETHRWFGQICGFLTFTVTCRKIACWQPPPEVICLPAILLCSHTARIHRHTQARVRIPLQSYTSYSRRLLC